MLFAAIFLLPNRQTSPGIPISSDRLAAESGVLLPLARMQNVPPPPPGCVSKGISHSGSAAGHANSVPSDPYAMSAQEKSKYESIFPMYDSDRDGFVTGPEAVDLFSKSRLPRDVSFAPLLRRSRDSVRRFSMKTSPARSEQLLWKAHPR